MSWKATLCTVLLSLSVPMAYAQATWTEPATGLMWTSESNGTDVNWNQARDYCSSLTLDAISNWRLPSIDELAGIYDERQKIEVGVKFPYWHVWSGSAAPYSGEAWDFTFVGVGVRGYFPIEDGTRHQTLCVRSSGDSPQLVPRLRPDQNGPALPAANTAPAPSIAQLRLPSSYANAQTPADRLQLNTDKSFSLQEGGQPYHGTFVESGDTLELSIDETGIKTTLSRQGNNLSDSSGQTWSYREQSAATAAPGEAVLHNEDIIKMAKAGLDDALIISKISRSKCQFDTSTDALIQLKKQGGVSASVLKAMVAIRN